MPLVGGVPAPASTSISAWLKDLAVRHVYIGDVTSRLLKELQAPQVQLWLSGSFISFAEVIAGIFALPILAKAGIVGHPKIYPIPNKDMRQVWSFLVSTYPEMFLMPVAWPLLFQPISEWTSIILFETWRQFRTVDVHKEALTQITNLCQLRNEVPSPEMLLDFIRVADWKYITEVFLDNLLYVDRMCTPSLERHDVRHTTHALCQRICHVWKEYVSRLNYNVAAFQQQVRTVVHRKSDIIAELLEMVCDMECVETRKAIFQVVVQPRVKDPQRPWETPRTIALPCRLYQKLLDAGEFPAYIPVEQRVRENKTLIASSDAGVAPAADSVASAGSGGGGEAEAEAVSEPFIAVEKIEIDDLSPPAFVLAGNVLDYIWTQQHLVGGAKAWTAGHIFQWLEMVDFAQLVPGASLDAVCFALEAVRDYAASRSGDATMFHPARKASAGVLKLRLIAYLGLFDAPPSLEATNNISGKPASQELVLSSAGEIDFARWRYYQAHHIGVVEPRITRLIRLDGSLYDLIWNGFLASLPGNYSHSMYPTWSPHMFFEIGAWHNDKVLGVSAETHMRLIGCAISRNMYFDRCIGSSLKGAACFVDVLRWMRAYRQRHPTAQMLAFILDALMYQSAHAPDVLTRLANFSLYNELVRDSPHITTTSDVVGADDDAQRRCFLQAALNLKSTVA